MPDQAIDVWMPSQEDKEFPVIRPNNMGSVRPIDQVVADDPTLNYLLPDLMAIRPWIVAYRPMDIVQPIVCDYYGETGFYGRDVYDAVIHTSPMTSPRKFTIRIGG